MKMKRYFAADARQALKELRDDQGPDAVILSNRRVDGGVEIIAALDYEDSLEHSSLGKPQQLAQPSASDAQAGSAGSTQTPHQRQRHAAGDVDADMLAAINSELKGLRDIMEAPMMQMAWGEMSRVQPLQANLLKHLMAMGLDARLSQSLCNKIVEQGIDRHSWKDAVKLLSAIVPVADNQILDRGGIISMVGPTGVGKTTTIAKLAARFALRHGRKRVSLITTDSYRIAAHEQLRTYGRILGVPVQIATDAEELGNALQAVERDGEGPHLTLIDTAGIGQADTRLVEHLSTLRVDGMDIDNYLVLSATGQLNQQDNVVRAFARADLKACILTKTDEATSLGEVLSVLIQNNLPLAFVCDGQKVPDDIHQARGKGIVKQALEMMKQTQHSPSVEELAFRFGGITGGVNV